MRMIWLACCALLLGAASAATAADQPLSAAQQVREMQRGVNIVGYDPLWQNPQAARFKPRHFEIIRTGGFSSVRIVLMALRFMNEKNELPRNWFDTLDALVDGALAQGLNVIIDEHDYSACGRDVVACRPKLMAFWTQVAAHYKDAPNKVMFEILNEPNESTNEVWNEVHAEALAIIRKTNPTRNVIIGPAFWNNVNWLDRLVLPEKDRHIIVTVHYYLPMSFTHQGANWTPEYANLSGNTWGTAADQAALDKDLDGVQVWARRHDRPILLGEFGAYNKGPIESRVRYTAAVARGAEQRGWAWAYWQFDRDFIVYDIDQDHWVEPIRRALIPQAAN
jgi:endoglucanase